MLTEKLKKIELFSELSEDELKGIADSCNIKKLNKGNILFYEGDPCEAFYILIEGELKIYKTGIKSQELILHYFNAPSMIAEMATLENMNFPATSAALVNDTVVAIIDKSKFLDLIKSYPELSFHMMRSLTAKIKNLETLINRNLVFDATAKVCSLIKEDKEILINKKNIQIANLLNMAPETLSRILKKLKKLNILDQNNILIDEEKLDMFLEI